MADLWCILGLRALLVRGCVVCLRDVGRCVFWEHGVLLLQSWSARFRVVMPG